MSSVEIGQMSAVETGQMSAAETGQTSAAAGVMEREKAWLPQESHSLKSCPDHTSCMDRVVHDTSSES